MYHDFFGIAFVGMLFFILIFIAIAVTIYVFSSFALYKMAKNRGINNPWMAWIPFANMWIWGELGNYFYRLDNAPKENLPILLLVFTLGGLIPIIGFASTIIALVLQYMVLYQIYKHTTPNNAVVFLVLSIIFPVTMPFFLFAQRNKIDVL